MKKNCENMLPVSSLDLDKPSKSRRFENFSDKDLKKHSSLSQVVRFFQIICLYVQAKHIWINIVS